MRGRSDGAIAAAAALACLMLAFWAPGATASAPPIHRGPAISPSDFPNDPGFAPCEPQDPVTGCGDNEQWNLFGPLKGNTCLAPGGTVADRPHPDGGLPCWALDARDPDHAAGVDITGAWAQGNFGRPDVRIAYIEGGVNYSNDGIKDALDNIYLNKGELPYPEGANGKDRGTYDFDHNGHFDIRDYAEDPRVNPPCVAGTAPFTKAEEGTTRGCVAGGKHQYINKVDIGGTPTPYLSPEDLIAVFGHCRLARHKLAKCPVGGRFDNDGNGYPNDVSGWNTERNNNDPQTEDSAYSHAPGLISDLAGVANNHYAGVGVCERCTVIPIKQGAEAVGRSDQWGEALLYAVDAGAKVVSSVVVEYTYTSFAREAVDYANRKGVLLSLDSNDFDSLDHSDGMLYDHAIPGNSLTQEPDGRTTQWFRARSDVTSYGPHNVFSGEGNSTSGATPFMAGMLAMVQSAALNARDRHIIPRQLTPNEVRQVMMDTVSPVIPQTQAPNVAGPVARQPQERHRCRAHELVDAVRLWPSRHRRGDGSCDVGTRAAHGRARLASLVCRTSIRLQQRRLKIRGNVAPSAWRSHGVRWTLEWALGRGPRRLGLPHDRARPRRSARRAWHAGPAPDPAPICGQGPVVDAAAGRARAVHGHAAAARARRQRPQGRGSPRLRRPPRPQPARRLSALDRVGDERRTHLRPPRGASPARSRLRHLRRHGLRAAPERQGGARVPRPHDARSSRPPRDLPRRFVQERHEAEKRARPGERDRVGDIDHDGRQDVVATTSNAFVYAWDAHGKLRNHFPVHSRSAFDSLPVPTPRSATPHSRLPSRGNWSPPVLADLQGNGRLDILMSAFDGFVYAWQPTGRPVPGWPVEVKLPASLITNRGRLHPRREADVPAQRRRRARNRQAAGVRPEL